MASVMIVVMVVIVIVFVWEEPAIFPSFALAKIEQVFK
jgi:hypothetical protein